MTPICLLRTKKIAETVLPYVFKMVFPASPLQRYSSVILNVIKKQTNFRGEKENNFNEKSKFSLHKFFLSDLAIFFCFCGSYFLFPNWVFQTNMEGNAAVALQFEDLVIEKYCFFYMFVHALVNNFNVKFSFFYILKTKCLRKSIFTLSCTLHYALKDKINF